MRELREEDKEQEGGYHSPKKKGTKKAIYLAIFFVILMMFFSLGALMSDEDGGSFFSRIPIVKDIKRLAESSDKKLNGEERGRINILLLGMGGDNHAGGKLTDTIMLASLKPDENKAALISIPRDMTIPVEGKGWQKINSINAYAEFNGEDGGEALSQAVSDVLKMPIDYYVKADFQGFIDVVDELGGVNVYVEDTLNDYQYPVKGREDADNYQSRYEHLYIEKGWQEMDGELALKYARSRHAAGAQGSDFARARRQQKILQAAKEKFQETNIILKPSLISNILNELKDHISTDLKIWEMIKLWEMGKNIDPDQVKNEVLDDGPSGLLSATKSEGGAYILVPRGGDFSEIQYKIHNIFTDPEESRGNKTQTRQVEDVKISIRNGTWINGLAGRTAIELEKEGFDVVRVANSSKKDFQSSVIYDLAFGEKTEALKILKERTGANVSFTLPQWLIDDIDRDVKNETNPQKPDFILILGKNANKEIY
jgi:LCP family protein required for cell wall assembly